MRSSHPKTTCWKAIAVIAFLAVLSIGAAAQPKEATWKAYIQRGFSALKQGQYARSEQLFRAAISEAGKLNQGDQHSVDLMIVSLNGLGEALRAQRKFPEAEQSCRKLVSLMELARSEDDSEYALALSNLGLVLSEQKKYEESEAVLQKALELRERYEGAQHPDVAASLLNLGKLYQDQGNHAQAETFYRRASTILLNLPANQRTADAFETLVICLNNLAAVYIERHDYDSAESVYKSSIDKVLVPQAPAAEQKKYLTNYAQLLELMNRPTEARKLQERARLLNDSRPGKS